MSFNLLLVLLCLTVFCGVVMLVDTLFQRQQLSADPNYKRRKLPIIIEYCRDFFWVLLIVFFIRSFLFQPFKVPTGSLEPTLIPDAYILVKQYPYGIKFPVWNKQIIPIGKPKRGQIALFYYPVDHSLTYVKRVIGLPGDKISYINKVLYINGKKMSQKLAGTRVDTELGQANTPVNVYEENLMGLQHKIQLNPQRPSTDFYNLTVPQGEYFMMGDNRDDSADSRYFGFVKQNDFIGQAFYVFFSWDHQAHGFKKIRSSNMGSIV